MDRSETPVSGKVDEKSSSQTESKEQGRIHAITENSLINGKKDDI